VKSKNCPSISALMGVVAMPQSKNIDLSGLKDVILGEKPSIFPLTIGWWIVLSIVFIGLFITFLYVKKRFFPSPYEYALDELKRIKKQTIMPVEVGKELSKLLKRVAIFKFGREEVSLLTDDEWAKFLRTNGKNFLTPDEADFIAQSTWMPPQKDIAISLENLYTHTKDWIKFVLKEK